MLFRSLDMASIDALVYALTQFEGTLVFISHDVYFIRALGNLVVHVNAGKLTSYAGDYQYYLDKTNATSARAALTSGNLDPSGSTEKPTTAPRAAVDRKEQKRIEAQERQARSGARKAQQQKVHLLEKEIQNLETRQAEITAEMENPLTYEKQGLIARLNWEMSDIQQRLDVITPEWEAEASKLATIQ